MRHPFHLSLHWYILYYSGTEVQNALSVGETDTISNVLKWIFLLERDQSEVMSTISITLKIARLMCTFLTGNKNWKKAWNYFEMVFSPIYKLHVIACNILFPSVRESWNTCMHTLLVSLYYCGRVLIIQNCRTACENFKWLNRTRLETLNFLLPP